MKYEFLLVVLSLKLSGADAKLCAGAGRCGLFTRFAVHRTALFVLTVSARQRVGTHTPAELEGESSYF